MSLPSENPPPPEAKSSPERALPEAFGRYKVLRELGRGAMGAVWLAHDTQLDRRVALKVPTGESADAPEVTERFFREARAAATLEHRNIGAVYDVGEVGGIRYIAMAYSDGRPLSAYIRPDKPLPPRQVATLVRKLALALAKAHAKGVIHRDLKPSNVMIDRDGEPVIMDFGLARRVGNEGQARLTHSGMVLGSPASMSPEQIHDSGDVGPESDVYSLGVILYELLAGEMPFRGPVTSVLGQILTASPAPPHEVRPGVDPELEALCLAMMAKSRDERVASMNDVAGRLAGYLRGTSKTKTAAAPSAAGTRLAFRAASESASPGTDAAGNATHARPPGRRRLWVAGAGLVSLAGLLTAALLLPTGERPVPSSQDPSSGAEAGDQPAPSPADVTGPVEALSESDPPVPTCTDLATGTWVPVAWSDDELAAWQAGRPGDVAACRGDALMLIGDGRELPVPGVTARDVLLRVQVKKVSGRHPILVTRLSPQGNCTVFLEEFDDFGTGVNVTGVGWRSTQHFRTPEEWTDWFEWTFAAVGGRVATYVNGRRILQFDNFELGAGGLAIAVRGKSLFRNVEYMVLDSVRVPDYAPLATGTWRPVTWNQEELKTQRRDLRPGGTAQYKDGTLSVVNANLDVPRTEGRDVLLRVRVRRRGSKVGLQVRETSRGYTAVYCGGGTVWGLGKGGRDGRDGFMGWRDLDSSDPVHVSPDREFEYVLAAVGNRLEVYADGIRIHSATDGAPVVGGPSIQAHDEGLFSRVEVMLLDAPPRGSQS